MGKLGENNVIKERKKRPFKTIKIFSFPVYIKKNRVTMNDLEGIFS